MTEKKLDRSTASEADELTPTNLLQNLPGLKTAQVHEQLESTNDLAKQMVVNDETIPCLVLAHRQTKGRGRGGKTWLSGQGSLTFSFLIDRAREINVPRFSLTWGLAVSQTLNQLASSGSLFQIKWPNDVMVSGKKVAGILIESSAQRPNLSIVGIGINLGVDVKELKKVAAEDIHPLSVTEVTSRPISGLKLLSQLWTTFHEIQSLPTADWMSLFAQLDCLVNRRVKIEQGNEVTVGICRGIDEHSALLVDGGQTIHRFHSGSVVEFAR